MSATRIAVAGFSSNVGKTTLVCELLKRNPGWEAIKISRGHYRSCGKDPQACCISPLLGEKPLVIDGREATYKPGKDTGRYWDAGATRVQWVICTTEQLEEGACLALERVAGPGVFIEGTSIIKQVGVDYSIMVVDASLNDIKSSALSALSKTKAIYVTNGDVEKDFLLKLRERVERRGGHLGDLPVYSKRSIDDLTRQIEAIHKAAQIK